MAIQAALDPLDTQDAHLAQLIVSGNRTMAFGYSLRHHADHLDKFLEKSRRDGKAQTMKARVEAHKFTKTMATAFKAIRVNNIGPMLHTTETYERLSLNFHSFSKV